jgi:hypothetical protein
MLNERMDALTEAPPFDKRDKLASENRRMREALILARAEINFALCFKEFGPVRHMLESVIETMRKALAED